MEAFLLSWGCFRCVPARQPPELEAFLLSWGCFRCVPVRQPLELEAFSFSWGSFKFVIVRQPPEEEEIFKPWGRKSKCQPLCVRESYRQNTGGFDRLHFHVQKR